MRKVSFKEIVARLNALEISAIDGVVGIATGGMVPATLLADRLACELFILHINFRDEQNTPRYAEPYVYADVPQGLSGKKLLLVDDVSVSGATLAKAKDLFKEAMVQTVVLLGEADHVVFPEFTQCVAWPWRASNPQLIKKG